MNSVELEELDPAPPPKSVEESLAAYFEMLDLGEGFVRAGLRDRLGPDADIDAAFREWNREAIRRAAEEKIRYLEEALIGRVGNDR